MPVAENDMVENPYADKLSDQTHSYKPGSGDFAAKAFYKIKYIVSKRIIAHPRIPFPG